MKGLLHLAGVAHVMRGVTPPDNSPSLRESWEIDWNKPTAASSMRAGVQPDNSPAPMASWEVDWNNPTAGTNDAQILAHSMIAGSLERGWKGDPRWRSLGLHQNPARLWRFLQDMHPNQL
jgi:hypothetical protein